MPISVVCGRISSPAGPASRKAMATICAVVFHLAIRVTGTLMLTFNCARYSRSPDTRISRQRMMIAAHSDQPAIVWSAATSNRIEAISSLSAMGSSMRPIFDVWFHIRAR